jgi:beta-lactam-binding protein with PASTA domain
VPEGASGSVVVGKSPAAGTSVPTGSRVDLRVAGGAP